MSRLILHYGSIEDAAKQADKASTELEDYKNKVDGVAIRISSYSGAQTANISTALSFSQKKSAELQTKADAFSAYAKAIRQVRTDAESADQQIQGRVSSLTASFKAKYGIKTDVVTEIFSYIGTAFNSSALGRWLKDSFNRIGDFFENTWDSIKDWYKYQGGKYIVDIIIDVLLIVAVIVILVVTFPVSTFVAVAAIIGTAITIADCLTDIVNSAKAYNSMQEQDPVTAKRWGNLNTLTDTMRNQSDSHLVHAISYGIDTIDFVCDMITLSDGIADPDTWLSFGGFAKAFGGDILDLIMGPDSDFRDSILDPSKDFKKMLEGGVPPIPTGPRPLPFPTPIPAGI